MCVSEVLTQGPITQLDRYSSAGMAAARNLAIVGRGRALFFTAALVLFCAISSSSQSRRSGSTRRSSSCLICLFLELSRRASKLQRQLSQHWRWAAFGSGGRMLVCLSQALSARGNQGGGTGG